MASTLRSGLSRVRDILPAAARPKTLPPAVPAAAAATSLLQNPQTLDQLLASLGTRKPTIGVHDPSKPARKRIRVHPSPAPAPPKNALTRFTTSQLKSLDPKGARTRLFSRANKDAIRPGDTLQVRFRDANTEPFAGVLLNIRRRGLDTAFLLRNHLTRVGVEMWHKLYSPKIAGIDLIQRKERRARRAKLYYMRKPKHDVGSVEGVVTRWKKNRLMFGGTIDVDIDGRKMKVEKKKFVAKKKK
ncbi:hypothetical protein TWF696_007217 [Orbilia brochopaga]|uniref:Mitochondrial ribosomal protein L19 n=1 Tax=Orbilia brochopaga TaxID=3140254 RepID=A0AAV9URB3_9PEZI